MKKKKKVCVSSAERQRGKEMCNAGKYSRRILTTETRCQLEVEFLVNVHWSKAHVIELAQRLGISRMKVYKWNFDRTKKE